MAYWLQHHPNESNALLLGGCLFTHYIVDMFASIDQQWLRFLKHLQPLFQAARFNNLEDTNMADPDNLDLNKIRQRVFLSFSYMGGLWYMVQSYQDSMVVACFF